jgi:hypothetical protein
MLTSNLSLFYKDLLTEFETDELLSVSKSIQFDNFFDCMTAGKDLYKENKNETLIKRKQVELHFYSYLKHQLFHKLQEIKAYSEVNINDTRRLIAVSPDCISMLHILVRDEIHLNVYLRSSDYDGALVSDLEFISSLPYELIRHLSKLRNEDNYSECDEEFFNKIKSKGVIINIFIGSLHRTI